ncbi:hypothetical protein PWT90_11124 [Aphanocladium album]|nr:hypothetical protein PWT90_11124 [Aphanocladium album]
MGKNSCLAPLHLQREYTLHQSSIASTAEHALACIRVDGRIDASAVPRRHHRASPPPPLLAEPDDAVTNCRRRDTLARHAARRVAAAQIAKEALALCSHCLPNPLKKLFSKGGKEVSSRKPADD